MPGGAWFLASLAGTGLGGPVPALGDVSSSPDLTQMSLTDLASVEVTSVSKSVESLQHAPAAIYVITHEDIMRSGATSVTEALHLAPNLLVTQTSANAYTIAARGFGGNPQAQNFSNKLLILIDGRSVYTPLFSGIYSDTIDVMLEDVDRIEVVSGVGATLWGANAMNGVINIITRPSYLTQDGFLEAEGGNQADTAAVRYGGRLNGDATARVYGFAFHRGAMELPDGTTAHDGWSKGQGGFRSDWLTERDSVTLQGDAYRGTEHVLGNSDSLLAGANLVARYQHHAAASEFQAQAYVDQNEQFGASGNTGFVVHTYDVSVQETVNAGSDNRLTAGAGERLYEYGITNTATLLFEPPGRALTLANLFLEDTLTLVRGLDLTVGIKLEDDPYSGWAPLPDARLAFGVNDRTTVWLAASRAIRSPTPFDEDVVEKSGGATLLVANPRFKPETLTAFELGVRAQPSSAFSFSIAGFYNIYDDLRTIDPASADVLLPFRWGNSLRGDTDGIDAWAAWQINDWWRLSPGVTWVHENLEFKPGSTPLLGVAQAADDPGSHATLASSMNLPQHLSFDASLRYVGALPNPALRSYCELDARLGWRPTDAVDVSLAGTNLLHPRHLEFPVAAGGEEITRGVVADVRWKF